MPELPLTPLHHSWLFNSLRGLRNWALYCLLFYFSICVKTTSHWSPHRLNMELDLHSLFRLHVHSCTHWLRPRNNPPPPRIWAHMQGRYWSAEIDDISSWPPESPSTSMIAHYRPFSKQRLITYCSNFLCIFCDILITAIIAFTLWNVVESLVQKIRWCRRNHLRGLLQPSHLGQS